ncbi:MAG: rhodanese-related sulfurtransferase [Paracoccaceae bacterium]|jgi:rhodanese-related sulfurtransferase
MPAFNEITPATLMRLIGTPTCPVLVDVCIDDDHAEDPFLVPTARRTRHTDLDALLARTAGHDTVVICQKGKKLSHGVAAWLRAHGVDAQVLEGGNNAWRDAALPRVPVAAIPAPLWVSRHRPKIDRVACPWLIRRFVDPCAQFLFVPPADVLEVAQKFNATPFDVEGVMFTHRGTLCTFDTMIAEFGLSHRALDRLALVVRAADTDDHAASPQAAGLLAMSVGLSRMYRDDLAQMEAGMGLYDALYRWARDGIDETHDWPAGAPQ